MTTEEKAKAYDMALEAARKELGVDRKEWEVVQRVLHNIFSELRENEDERIRKKLYHTVLGTPPDNEWFEDISQDAMLAWLEKQKESLHIAETCKEKADSLTEWSEDDRKMVDNILAELWCHVNYSYPTELASTTAMATYKYQKEIDWLKSLRPQKNCSGCSKHLEGYISGRGDAENKLLEDYGILVMPDGELRMKPKWKPSEEQIYSLGTVVKGAGDVSEGSTAYHLQELYEQLKSL